MKWKDTFVKAVISWLAFGEAGNIYFAMGILALGCFQYIMPRIIKNLRLRFCEADANPLSVNSIMHFSLNKIKKMMTYLTIAITWLWGAKALEEDDKDELIERMCNLSGSVYVE